MSTAQIYAGKGRHASPVEPTAPRAPHNHQVDLFALLDQFVREDSAASSVEFLLDATYDRFNRQVGIDPEREVDPRKTYTLHEHDLSELYTGMRLVYFVTAIKEKWKLVRSISEQKGGKAHV